MHPKFIARFTRYLRLCQGLSRILPPALSLPLCAWLSRLDILPRPGNEDWGAALEKLPHLSDKVFKEHLSFVGVMEGAAFYFRDFEKMLPGVKFAPNLAGLPNLAGGVLILTYHHHFNVLLCAFLGRLLNRRVNVLAMDPDLSPLAKPLAWYKDVMYGDSETQLSGGRYVLVHPGSGNAVGQGLRDMVRRDSALISVHDFGHPFANESVMSLNVLGRKLLAPVGAIAFAVSRKIPVFVTWLEWDGGARFIIKGTALDTNSEESVLKGYVASLETMVAENPAQWEGWPSICNMELAEVPG